MQNTSRLLMIRPVNFRFNAETAVNNAFQLDTAGPDTQQKALAEFDAFVALLRANGIQVEVIDDTPEPVTPDSIFPNNWISFHEQDKVLLYPMFAPNRRAERKQGVLDQLAERFRFGQPLDLSGFEKEERYLEGTGSMVLDRDARISYACLSPRTDIIVLEEFCRLLNYHPVVFNAVDEQGRQIYHTNVLMCVADKFVVVCLDSITDETERKIVTDNITRSGKEVIPISFNQLHRFAGNMLQVVNSKGEKLLVMSEQAFRSLTPSQIKKLESHNRILYSSLNTIETNGGGSARCMMAEIFLQPKYES